MATRLWVMTALVLLVGCDDDLRTLGPNDVSGIPPGDAVGMLFSGQYLVTSNRIEGCDCRRGSCATLSAVTGVSLLFTQTEGLLQMMGPTTPVLAQGGVNADGRYKVGWAQEDPGNIQYAFLEGKFSLSGSTPISVTGLQEVTVHHTVYDCDLKTRFVADYQAPLAAAFVEAAGGGSDRAGVGPIPVARQ